MESSQNLVSPMTSQENMELVRLTKEHELMRMNDERELHLLLLLQKERILTKLNVMGSAVTVEVAEVPPIKLPPLKGSENKKSPVTNIVSPTRSSSSEKEVAALLPSTLNQTKRKLPSLRKSIPSTSTIPPAVKQPFASLAPSSDPKTVKLLEDTVNLILADLLYDVLVPHALSISITSMGLEIPVSMVLNQIQYSAGSIDQFFDNSKDERINLLKLLKLLDSTTLQHDQRVKLRILYEEVCQITTEPNWNGLLKRVIKDFLIHHTAPIALAQQLGAKLSSCEVILSPYIYRSTLQKVIILLKAPQSKLKKPKHYVVPLLLPEVSSQAMVTDFLPGNSILHTA